MSRAGGFPSYVNPTFLRSLCFFAVTCVIAVQVFVLPYISCTFDAFGRIPFRRESMVVRRSEKIVSGYPACYNPVVNSPIGRTFSCGLLGFKSSAVRRALLRVNATTRMMFVMERYIDTNSVTMNMFKNSVYSCFRSQTRSQLRHLGMPTQMCLAVPPPNSFSRSVHRHLARRAHRPPHGTQQSRAAHRDSQ